MVLSDSTIEKFGSPFSFPAIRAVRPSDDPWNDPLDAINILELSPHDGGVSVDPSPILDADHTLIDEHAQAIDDGAAASFCVLDQMGAGRTRNDIRDDHPGFECFDVDVEPTIDVRSEDVV